MRMSVEYADNSSVVRGEIIDSIIERPIERVGADTDMVAVAESSVHITVRSIHHIRRAVSADYHESTTPSREAVNSTYGSYAVAYREHIAGHDDVEMSPPSSS